MVSKQDLARIAELRADGLAQGWPILQIVEALVDRFGVSRLEAHRLARGWTRARAVEVILATYDADGWPRARLTPQRLCAWERDPRVRPGEDYLDRLCRVYETRPDQLGYGRDYTPAGGEAGAEPPTAYAGIEAQADGEETATDRKQLLGALGATGLAALLDRASKGSMRLGGKLGSSNLGPATLEQLELRVASFFQDREHTPSGELFPAVLAQMEEVEALLDGRQPLKQRRELHRIVGQLSMLLGGLSHDLGDYPGARAHLLTALQLAREVGDHSLLAWVRVQQSTVALWAGDFRAALDYAQNGQRYATGAMRARLAARCEARAFARMRDLGHVFEALRRGLRAMPSQPGIGEPDGWWVFMPADLELYAGISLLWLGQPEDAEPHARQAIASYQAAPLALQSPPDQAQAQINLAICLARQDQPDEGIRLVTDALGVDREREANLQQAGEFLTALGPGHRDLPAARDLAEQLRSIRASRPGPSRG
ncbi:MAG: tetratricopeptide repeat protein [Egibacteraceae bacterium]